MEVTYCRKCGDNTHVSYNCTMRIRIPHHIKISWECPKCNKYFEGITPSIIHEYSCNINPLTSSVGRIYSHLPKISNTLLELPKIYPPSQK